MESRYKSNAELAATRRVTDLPVDFLHMVQEIFTNHFEQGLKAFSEITPGGTASFRARGAIFPNEIILAVTLHQEGQISATTVHASCDFDPKASAPKAEDVLKLCVDAAGSVFQDLMDPKSPEKLRQMADESLSALEDVPFDWTAVEVQNQRIFLKVDKSNPDLDAMADQFLRENDPEFLQREAREEKATEQRFVTGPKKGGSDDSSGNTGGSGLLH